MFRTIDIYIIKKYLGTFIFTILLFTAIIIVFDYSEKTDNFVQHKAPLKGIWFEYFLNFIPYLISMFIPLFSFITVVFFTSKMAYRSEIIAILSNGISFRRLLRPYLISALVLAIVSFFLNNYIIPPSNEKRIAFESVYIKPGRYKTSNKNNIYKQVYPNVYVQIKHYYPDKQYGRNFIIEQYENNQLLNRIVAAKITWMKETEKWKLTGCRIRTISDGQEIMKTIPRIDTTFNLLPNELIARKNVVETMNLNELRAFIKDQSIKGSGNIDEYKMELYRRLINPIAIFILTLIGVSLASRKMKGGIGLHIGLGLLLSFSYIFFMRISSFFEANGTMSPLFAILSPNIVYAFIAYILYRLAPK